MSAAAQASEYSAEKLEAVILSLETERDRRRDPAGVDVFTCDQKGAIYVTQANVAIALRKLGVVVRYDELAQQELIDGLDGFGPWLDDAAMTRLRMKVDSTFAFRVGKDFFYDVVADQARLNRFHPLRDYLDALTWDRRPRLDRWLVDYGGAKDTAYVRAVSRIVLIAAVQRARHPGSKYDEMLILESEQGTDKSSALRVLAVCDDWFTDDLPLAADTKRQMEATAGKWIVEAGELKGMSRADVAALKGYLSRQRDEARLSYGRKTTISPRQFVIIGTTNEADGYLKDATGNRRFWPVRIERFDVRRLRADRDQLWAEAAQAEAAGESIRLDPELWVDAGLEQDNRRREDPLVAVLDRALGDHVGKLRVDDAYRLAGIEPGKASQEQMERVGAAMRELGWDRKRKRFAGDLGYAYVKGTLHEQETALQVEIDGAGVKATAHVTRRLTP